MIMVSQEADLVLEEDFVDALVAMVRSLPLGDIWQTAPALLPPQRRRPGASDAPSPSEQALQVQPYNVCRHAATHVRHVMRCVCAD